MSYPKFCPEDIIAVDVFLEYFQTRTYVGILKKEKNEFVFSYDMNYLKIKQILPLGPEFHLTQQEFYSKELFPSFLDRLPDPNNPSYAENCTHVGIASTTTDPIVLLAKFKRGPSSFIFEPVYKNKYSYNDIEKLRKELGLSLQDFSHLFDVSISAMQKIKTGNTSGKEVLRQIGLYLREPEELDYQIQRKIKHLHPNKTKTILEFLKNNLDKERYKKNKMLNRWHILSYHECNYTQKCLKQLQYFLWANKIIENTNNKGLTPKGMPYLFEARFAYALHKTGYKIENAYKCGTKSSEIKDSDVDFRITKPDDTIWYIELTSLDESDEVKTNTVVNGDIQFYTDKGIEFYKAYERAQSSIFGKVAKKIDENTAKPTKFLSPVPGEYNIIIIDMRGFMVATPDNHDYAIIVNGENNDHEIGFKGLFNPNHPSPQAKYLRERIHGIGFINEKEYDEGEIQRILELFPNPRFLSEDKLKRDFPLQKV